MKEKERVDRLLLEAKKAVRAKALERAAEHLLQALAINPENTSCLDLLGFVFFFQKRYVDSEACCRKVLAKKPNHAYALSGLGMNLSKQGKLEEGLKCLYQAIEMQPGWPEAYWDLAIVLKDARRYDAALRVLKSGLISCSDSRTRFEELISHIEHLQGE